MTSLERTFLKVYTVSGRSGRSGRILRENFYFKLFENGGRSGRSLREITSGRNCCCHGAVCRGFL